MQLSYDTLQLAGMLYLTGGITNPFSLLLIAPAVLAAATLPSRHALVIGSLTLLASLLLTVMPLHSGGGLAVAAAHELGTPLATIAVVAREMARKAKSDDDRADAELMIAQAVRCREILAQLTAKPVAADNQLNQRLSLLQLLHGVIEPHAG